MCLVKVMAKIGHQQAQMDSRRGGSNSAALVTLDEDESGE
jgi:hypothetical protein